jgi:hypothetical protein
VVALFAGDRNDTISDAATEELQRRAEAEEPLSK